MPFAPVVSRAAPASTRRATPGAIPPRSGEALDRTRRSGELGAEAAYCLVGGRVVPQFCPASGAGRAGWAPPIGGGGGGATPAGWPWCSSPVARTGLCGLRRGDGRRPVGGEEA